jgi:hypothetical protein
LHLDSSGFAHNLNALTELEMKFWTVDRQWEIALLDKVTPADKLGFAARSLDGSGKPDSREEPRRSDR